jgi:membrane associated rhomboid family serine protease
MAGRRHQEEQDHQHLNAVVVATCHLGHELSQLISTSWLHAPIVSYLVQSTFMEAKMEAMERKLSHVYTTGKPTFAVRYYVCRAFYIGILCRASQLQRTANIYAR